jgi:hypothetical protein
MPTTLTPEPRTVQRPWRPVYQPPAQPRPLVEHRFVAPIVRELPPRRERLSAAW